MPAKGFNEVRQNINKIFERIDGPMAQQALYEALSIGGAYSDLITPVDTGNLRRSRFTQVIKTPSGWIGKYGYTANYALYVHEASGKLKGKPRSSVGAFDTKSGQAFVSDSGEFWEPHGEPEFLRKGFERDGRAEINEAIRRNMKL